MSVKIFFIDLDGTLLNKHDEVSAINIDAINKAKDAGIVVVISTGRALFESQYVIDIVKPDYYSGLNGSLIKKIATDEIIVKKFMEVETAESIVKLMDKLDMNYLITTYNGMFTPSKQIADIDTIGIGASFLKRFRKNIKPLTDVRTIEPVKINALAKNAKMSDIFREEIKHIPGAYAAYTQENGYDVIAKGQSKAESANKLCSMLGIDVANAAAIGDSDNDLEMLQLVGYSIAVENAFDSVKPICKYLVPSNDNDGVAYAIYNILGVNRDSKD